MTLEALIDAAFASIEAKLGTSRVSGWLKAALETFKPIVKADLLPGVNKLVSDAEASAHAAIDAEFATELAALKPAGA